MKKLLLLSFALVFALLHQAVAQSRTVTGTVTDQATGQGLPGVAVLVKGTSSGTATGSDGSYSITVPESGTTLVFRFLGYSTTERAIGSGNSINVALSVDDRQLSEVVVTGYATQSRQEFTGSAATVKGDAIKDRPVQSFAQALTGQAAGVNIVQPNGLLNNPPVIRIRGVNSISLSSFPLVVVDGIPISTSDASANSSTNNPLGDINPADIESVDILKDAASTSIYGSRAANGVLLITTKRGKQGKARVVYDGWVSTNKAVRLPELLNAQQYIDHKNTAIANALQFNANAVPANQRNSENRSFFPNYNPDGSMVDTDWYDEVYRTAISHNHNLTVSGGTDKTTYYFSGGYTDQEGFLKANEFQRRSGRFNIAHQATNWLNLTANVNYTNSYNSAPNSGSAPGAAFNSSGLGRIAVAMSPNLSPRNADGSYSLANNTIGNGNNLISTTWANPLPLIDLDKNISETSRMISNLGAEIKIIDGLTYKASYSWDRGNTENIQYWNPLQGDGWSYEGYSYNNTARRNNWNLVNTLQFTKSIADNHNLSLLVGSDAQKMRVENWGSIRQKSADPLFDTFQGAWGLNLAGGNGISQRVYEAYLASVNYNYAGKYFISANYRRDGNSALSPNNRWGDFGGASVGWTLSEEDFFKNSSLTDVVSNLRLKGSWGRVGNGNLPNDYGAYTTYGGYFYGSYPAIALNQIGNTDLKWETSKQTNVGFDISFLNNRISLEANYYKNDIDNLIMDAPQAPSKGIPGNSILVNVGSMYNRGYEFAINATPIDNGKFSWTANLNFTTNKNEVTALANDNAAFNTSTGGLETTNRTEVGYSVGSIYAVRTAGVNPENGRRLFINSNDEVVQYQHHGGVNAWTYLDGTRAPAVSGNDAVIVGNALPTWYGGFNNTLQYGNFDLNLMFTYSGGNYIYNGSQAGLRDQRVWNNSTDVLRSWTTPGQQTDIPRAIWGDNVSNGSSFAIDSNVEKGDFMRLQNATLGYRLPNVFGKTGISSVRVYAQVNNAFLITKYNGVDPEISTNGNTNTAPGVERNTIPQGRAFTFGVNLGL